MQLLGQSLTQLNKLLKKKEVSKEELSDYFYKRIQKYNPSLNAFLTIVKPNDEAGEKKRGVLEGIPLAYKDNFCTREIRTTAASKILDSFIPPYSATVVERLDGEGAINLGKTNMDAWAHGSSTETSDYGPTKNPWDVKRAPGGSSGGSAAAVASYLVPLAIGSETAGSIRQPASWCGVVGLKPTYGRVSRYGVIAMGSSLDCPGPITISVEDAALILHIIAGKDPYDATTVDTQSESYHTQLSKKDKFTIGIAEEYLEGATNEVKKSFQQTIEIFKKMGHNIKKIKLLEPQYAISVYTIIQRAEVSSNLARYDGIRYGTNRKYFGEEAKRRMMFGTYTLSHGYYDEYYKKAQKVRTLIIEDFKRVFKEVDFIAAPTTPTTALQLGEFEKYPFFGELMDVLNEAAAVSGIPALSIPIGLDTKHLPIGLQLMGNYLKESDLLNLAFQFEQETNFFDIIQKGMDKYRD